MLEDLFKNNKPLFIALIIVMLVLGTGVTVFNKVLKNPTTIDDETMDIEVGTQNLAPLQHSSYIYVHITGAVKKPGVYKVPSGKRAVHLVEMAGNFLPFAQTDEINLAETLKDGQKIMVPFVKPDLIGNGRGSDPIGASTRHLQKNIVNINTAGESGLDSLPGIGPSAAKRIIEYRNTNGPFKAIEELKNVAGIREGKFEKIKKLVRVQ